MRSTNFKSIPHKTGYCYNIQNMYSLYLDIYVCVTYVYITPHITIETVLLLYLSLRSMTTHNIWYRANRIGTELTFMIHTSMTTTNLRCEAAERIFN